VTEEKQTDDPSGTRPSAIGNFLGELRRREVLKTAGIYAGGAWLLTEILLGVLDRSPLAESTRALVGCIVVSVFISGFPIAIVLAWFFDVTRSGVSRDPVRSRGNPLASSAGLTAIVLATGVLMWQVNPCGLGRVLGIAVLPCSYYGDAEFAFQGPGVSEELNYRLSHLKQLRVPAWRSTAHFADQVLDPSDLSDTLGVDRLVECGMRRSESRVSINLQLFDPAADRNIWADEYQGQAADELLLIAEAFRDLIGVDALNISARAGGRIERINEAPTASGEAWMQFQRARWTEDSGDRAGAQHLYRETAGLDPSFARAHAAVARLHWEDARENALGDEDRRAKFSAAWAHTQRALAEAPQLAEALSLKRALLAEGIEPTSVRDDGGPPPGQTELHEQIINLRPSFAEEFDRWADWLEGEGRRTDADGAREKAYTLDPASQPGS
jgi:TolB-like protein